MRIHTPFIAALSAQLDQLAVCAVEAPLDPTAGEIQLFPAGTFRARDGRPANAPHWRIDATVAARLVERANARQTPFVIDYEHQTLAAKDSGHAAPAAGWFDRLEWREGKGLFAVGVRWTPRATEFLKNQEYRYISPVFKYASSGEVTEVMMAAITNFPALDGMREILAAATAMFATPSKPNEEERQMDLLKKLLVALGLAEDATEDAAMQAIKSLKDKADGAAAAQTQIADLTTQLEKAGKVDLSKYVPAEQFEQLRTEFTTLSTRLADDEVAALVDEGIKSKKLLPAQEKWATELGKQNIASLRTYLDNATPIAALNGTQSGGKPRQEGQEHVSDESLALCRQIGLDPAELTKDE